MKILLVHNKYGKFSGEEAVVDAQITLLKSNGHKVITYFRSSEELETMTNGKVKAFFSALYNSKSVATIKELLLKEEPDVVHIHNLYPLISPAILPVIKKMGFPIVMTVHNYRLLCPNGLFFTNGEICEKCTGKLKELNCVINNCEGSLFKSTGYALRNFLGRVNKYYKDNIDSYLCLTNFQKQKLVANGFLENKCIELPNFYNKSIQNKENKINKKNYIAFAGRISPEKGIPLLLDAARKLPQIPFKLAGAMLENYDEELTIPDNVELVGILNAKQLDFFYKNASIFVLSSICYEGFPMVFPEAMFHKLPIIAPNMAGYPEVVEVNKNGLLFKPNDVASLVVAISQLWEDPDLCKEMGVNGFQKVKKLYSSNAYYKRLNIVYQNVIEK